jgi:type II secretory pathway component PulF
MITFFKRLIHQLNLKGFRDKRDEFYEQLARAYENREGLRFFLDEELKISAARKTRDSSRAYALRLMRARLARGDSSSFSQILGAVMPRSDRLLLSALDDATDKPQLMRVIAQSIREQKLMQQTVRSKIIPPMLILPGAFGFTYVMATKSLPIILKVAPPGVWTPFNAAVRDFSLFVANYGGLLVLVCLGLLAFFSYQLPRWKGRLRSRLENMSPTTATVLFPVLPIALPVILYRDYQVGLVFNALSVMLQSGRTLKDALSAIRKQSQPWLASHLGRILRHLEANPTGYQRAFSSGLMSAHLLARLSSQIRSNPKFDEVLVRLGQEGSAEVRELVVKQMSVLNGIMLAMGGLVVVFVWLGQMSIGQSMQDELSPTKQMQKRLS